MTQTIARISITLSPLALLAACGQPATDTTAANATAVADDPFYQRIAALPEAQQRAVFLRAILDGGQQCQGVTDSARIDAVNGRPAWAATCQDGSRWQLVLRQDGVMNVTGPSPAMRPAS